MSVIGQPFEDDMDDLIDHNGRLLAVVARQATEVRDLRRENERRRGQMRRLRTSRRAA